eukprot:TRINITY_DN3892_c0_g1_i1.p1 TRINITY_DN3892_c0_g1~~TRINITY_DN3892_c0_g1_i1.p1  ORF type:complete len:396 (-),score=78.17 TRINITY_DN3892_c0_g1_i1:6-1193(-)
MELIAVEGQHDSEIPKVSHCAVLKFDFPVLAISYIDGSIDFYRMFAPFPGTEACAVWLTRCTIPVVADSQKTDFPSSWGVSVHPHSLDPTSLYVVHAAGLNTVVLPWNQPGVLSANFSEQMRAKIPDVTILLSHVTSWTESDPPSRPLAFLEIPIQQSQNGFLWLLTSSKLLSVPFQTGIFVEPADYSGTSEPWSASEKIVRSAIPRIPKLTSLDRTDPECQKQIAEICSMLQMHHVLYIHRLSTTISVQLRDCSERKKRIDQNLHSLHESLSSVQKNSEILKKKVEIIQKSEGDIKERTQELAARLEQHQPLALSGERACHALFSAQRSFLEKTNARLSQLQKEAEKIMELQRVKEQMSESQARSFEGLLTAQQQLLRELGDRVRLASEKIQAE